MASTNTFAAVVGKYLRQARVAAGLTQEAVAAKARISREYLSQLERDEKTPTVTVLVRVSVAMGTQGWKILRRAEEKA